MLAAPIRAAASSSSHASSARNGGDSAPASSTRGYRSPSRLRRAVKTGRFAAEQVVAKPIPFTVPKEELHGVASGQALGPRAVEPERPHHGLPVRDVELARVELIPVTAILHGPHGRIGREEVDHVAETACEKRVHRLEEQRSVHRVDPYTVHRRAPVTAGTRVRSLGTRAGRRHAGGHSRQSTASVVVRIVSMTLIRAFPQQDHSTGLQEDVEIQA